MLVSNVREKIRSDGWILDTESWLAGLRWNETCYYDGLGGIMEKVSPERLFLTAAYISIAESYERDKSLIYNFADP